MKDRAKAEGDGRHSHTTTGWSRGRSCPGEREWDKM
jgi:hypothetical protein